MKPYKIAKEYFPNKDNKFLDYVIWNETGFPSFWYIPEDGNTPEECFRKQLKECAEKIKKTEDI